jgi:hypothetical protein
MEKMTILMSCHGVVDIRADQSPGGSDYVDIMLKTDKGLEMMWTLYFRDGQGRAGQVAAALNAIYGHDDQPSVEQLGLAAGAAVLEEI